MKRILCIASIILSCFFSLNKSYSEEYDVVASKDFLRNWEGLGKYISYKKDKDGIIIELENRKKAKIYLLDKDVLRIRFDKNSMYHMREASHAILEEKIKSCISYSVEDDEKEITFKTENLSVKINKDKFKIAIYDSKNNLINEDDEKSIEWNGDRIVNYKKMNKGSSFFGFGEKTGGLLKNGTSMTMWNTDAYKYNKNTDPLYASIPFFIEKNKDYTVGILFDNTYQSFFDMGKSFEDIYYMGAVNGEINYYVFYGKTVKDVIEKYTEYTGRINMPPKWAIGHQQCRFSYFPDTRVEEIADKLRENKIPTDVIYLDIDFMEDFKSFTYNKLHFPEPKKLIDSLHKKGFKVITIIDPGIKEEKGYKVYDEGIKGGHFLKTPYGDYAKGEVWPGVCLFPDFGNEKTQKWWGTLYKDFLELGFDGFWNDMNEPSVFNAKNNTLRLDVEHREFGRKTDHRKMHNVYGQLMIKSTLEGIEEIRPDKRNFVLSRAGYAGLQRYAAKWTGDNTANWEHLKMNVPMVLNLGLSGVPFTGADVGGYTGTPSPELFIRWMQAGSMLPLFRNHTEKNTANQEAWEFGEEALTISRKYVELRYTLMQYFYDLFYESHIKGVPVARPVFMEFENDDNCITIENDFMLGSSLFVSPVVEEGAVEKEVYLPAGTNWYDYYTHEKYEGGKKYRVKADISTMPLFVKEGAIIPKKEVEQYIGEKKNNDVKIEIYYGKEGKYTLYTDDGESTKYKKGVYTLTEIERDNKTISVNNIEKNYPLENIEFKIYGEEKVKDVYVNDHKISGNYKEDKNSFKIEGENLLIRVENKMKNYKIRWE